MHSAFVEHSGRPGTARATLARTSRMDLARSMVGSEMAAGLLRVGHCFRLLYAGEGAERESLFPAQVRPGQLGCGNPPQPAENILSPL